MRVREVTVKCKRLTRTILRGRRWKIVHLLPPRTWIPFWTCLARSTVRVREVTVKCKRSTRTVSRGRRWKIVYLLLPRTWIPFRTCLTRHLNNPKSTAHKFEKEFHPRGVWIDVLREFVLRVLIYVLRVIRLTSYSCCVMFYGSLSSGRWCYSYGYIKTCYGCLNWYFTGVCLTGVDIRFTGD